MTKTHTVLVLAIAAAVGACDRSEAKTEPYDAVQGVDEEWDDEEWDDEEWDDEEWDDEEWSDEKWDVLPEVQRDDLWDFAPSCDLEAEEKLCAES